MKQSYDIKIFFKSFLYATLGFHLRFENNYNNCGASVFATLSKILLVDSFLPLNQLLNALILIIALITQ